MLTNTAVKPAVIYYDTAKFEPFFLRHSVYRSQSRLVFLKHLLIDNFWKMGIKNQEIHSVDREYVPLLSSHGVQTSRLVVNDRHLWLRCNKAHSHPGSNVTVTMHSFPYWVKYCLSQFLKYYTLKYCLIRIMLKINPLPILVDKNILDFYRNERQPHLLHGWFGEDKWKLVTRECSTCFIHW